MSSSNEQQCNYVLRQGKLKGTRCTHKISKKDPQHMQCSNHYYRFSYITPGQEKPSPAPLPQKLSVIIGIQKEEEKEILSEEIEKEFRERFEKEKKESLYRKWRQQQLQLNK